MQATDPMPFFSGAGRLEPQPLGRYLPLLLEGSVRDWLQENVPAGSWLLDPFGSQPALVLEAARAGYRVLTASNNPILSFMLEINAQAPQREDFESALAALAGSRRGEDRLENWLNAVYSVRCAACGAQVMAHSYVWRKDAAQPEAKIYHCPYCGDEGERPFTLEDAQLQPALGSDALHRSRALTRVASDADQTAQVEAALITYASRPLIILNTLINKTEGLNLAPEKKRLLTALLISACDEANTLWPHPSSRPRPKQLTIPPQYRENNLWLALENAVPLWTQSEQAVKLTHWPELPPVYGGICLFPRRVRTLFPLPETIQPAAVLGAIPRPNQAFWTFCALWSGWLWGREAVTPLRSSLDRRRYDWYWMGQALTQVFREVQEHLPPDLPVWLSGAEILPGFCLSMYSGPATAGLRYDATAFDPDFDISQMSWRTRPAVPAIPKARAAFPAAETEAALLEFLQLRAEPVSYTQLFDSLCRHYSLAQSLVNLAEAMPNDLLNRLQSALEQALRKNGEIIHYADAGASMESGWWGLTHNSRNDLEPLAERVERWMVTELVRADTISPTALIQETYRQFPGALTPGFDLLEAIFNSYAAPTSATANWWSLSAKDQPAARRSDLQEITRLLTALAERLGMQAEGELPLYWRDAQGELLYAFYPIASTLISRFFESPGLAPAPKRYLVLPGSRAELLSFKMDRNPQLEQQMNADWRILKFRHIRRLAQRNDLDLHLFGELINADPLEWNQATQTRMF
jgi:hypothetical protein